MVSYHTHTTWSDGAAATADMVRAAAQAGMREYGISDHFALIPGAAGDPAWAIDRRRLGEYVDDIQTTAAAADITVRLGIEVDFFPETMATALDMLAPYPFDYIIGSIHYLGSFPIDAHPRHWEGLTQAQIDDVFRDYWRLIPRLVAVGGVDFFGHLDLPKKFGYAPSVDLSAEIAAALDAIAAADVPIELNTAGWHRSCRECYPCESILAAAKRRDISVVLSDDAHAPDHIGQSFHRGAALLRRVGYTQCLQFAARRATPALLPEQPPATTDNSSAQGPYP